ncbi:SDR family oxidoreductase [Nonomuraea rhizosphaerae]|uniref:SDR family oxidoreductase n=1 Tax=Nonomuraea rhizosphaerae TaxID=2665663 RepID=UPI001C607985|nr:SDR family oxidoreductase [Nonomuraea rhizosphaerae]
MTNQHIALITGANKGVGYATARELARTGHVVLLGARNHERGTEAAASLSGEGLDVRFVPLDVTDLATIEAAAAYIDAEFGRLDILVNNAAITHDRPHKPSELPVAALRKVYETNVLGVVAVTNAMLPLLRRSQAGRIANVSSGLGTFAFLTDADSPFREYGQLLGYNSSKAALNAITLIYAAELADTRISVNAVSPGFCATDLNGHRGVLSAAEGGANIARQLTEPVTGAFLSETGGTVPW